MRYHNIATERAKIKRLTTPNVGKDVVQSQIPHTLVGVQNVKIVSGNGPGCFSYNQKYTYSSNSTLRYLLKKYESIFHKKTCTEMCMVLLIVLRIANSMVSINRRMDKQTGMFIQWNTTSNLEIYMHVTTWMKLKNTILIKRNLPPKEYILHGCICIKF